MGNVLEYQRRAAGQGDDIGVDDADLIEDDLKWLAVKGSMVFNDDFLEEEYASLPHYDGTEMPPDSWAGEGLGIFGGMPGEDAVQRMLQILGPFQESSGSKPGAEPGNGGQVTTVEDFFPLLGESYLLASTHSTAARMRARLFQRMHLAHLRQAYRSLSSLTDEAGSGALAVASAFASPPSAFAEGAVESDPAAILTSASMRMSLTLMGALRATCPGLFASMAQTLMDIFGASAPFALGEVGSSSAYMETLSQVRTVAEKAATAESGSPKEERAQAMALLLSLGIATGSLSDVVRVAKVLLEGDSPPLPPSARPFVERLKNHSMPPKLTIPRPSTWTAAFHARLETVPEVDGNADSRPRQERGAGRGGKGAAAAGGCCNPATDGVYVYVWEASTKRVHKVGTGFHGTLPGNVYCSSAKILDDIRAFKGMEPAEVEEDGSGSDSSTTSDEFEAANLARTDLDGGNASGVVVTAPYNRRLFGTGLNIGGGGGDGSDDSSSDSSFDIHSFSEVGSASASFDPQFGVHRGAAARYVLTSMPPFAAPRHVSNASSLSTSSGSGSSPSYSSMPRSPPFPVTSAGQAPQPPAVNLPDSAPHTVAMPMPSSRPIVSTSPLGDSEEMESPVFTWPGYLETTPSPERPAVRLHRVPPPVRTDTRTAAAAVTRTGGNPGPAVGGHAPGEASGVRSHSPSPPRAMDSIRGVMDALRTRRANARVGVGMSIGAVGGGNGTVSGNGARSNGLLNFRALESRVLLPEIGVSGHPDEHEDEIWEHLRCMEPGDLGDVLEHKVVHGFRWYRVRVMSRPSTEQTVDIIGWVPLKSCEFSDCGSMESEEKADLDGEEYIELLDPMTDGAIDPDSPRATSPPMWDEARAIAAAQNADGANGAVLGGAGAGSGIAGGSGRSGGSGAELATVRPVWLALAGGKLFLREKASGALSADEIAVLRLDLSLEGVVSLADLPIPGFPKSSEFSGAFSTPREGTEEVMEEGLLEEKEETSQEEKEAVTHEGTGGSPGAGNREVRIEDLMEFADTELGATVVECSSNSELSAGVLQNNLLVRQASQRLSFPPSGGRIHPDGSKSFFFDSDDRDRVLVVDLGTTRRVQEAGVEVCPWSYLDAAGAMSLLVETSVDSHTWDTLGWWSSPVESTANDSQVESEHEQRGSVYFAVVTAAAGTENPARFVRYSMGIPTGYTPSIPLMLSRLMARGLGGKTRASMVQEAFPFPAMTTDSRHVILVHVAIDGNGTKEDAETAGDGNEGSGRRLEVLFLDPKDEYRLVKTTSLAWGMDEVALHKSPVLCDGERLVLLAQQQDGDVQRAAGKNTVSMRCSSGAFVTTGSKSQGDDETRHQEEDMEFDARPAGGMVPTGLAYDCRNNMMWGWDPTLNKLCRWRNDGLSPVFAPPRPTHPEVLSPPARDASALFAPSTAVAIAAGEGKKPSSLAADAEPSLAKRMAWIQAMLASASPSHRVQGLEEAGSLEASDAGFGHGKSSVLSARREAALLLGYLERLAEPYAPPEEPVAEARVGCELEAASGALDDGNFSRLLVRGQDRSCKEPGVNVLVLTDALDAGGEIAKGFATHQSIHAANGLADYLSTVPHGRTVMIAVQEDATENIGKSNSAQRALMSVGAGRDEVSALGMHRRSSFAMIGRKGAKPGSVPQVLKLPQKGCATVRQRLPAPMVPMCIDVSKETLHALIELVIQHKHVLLKLEAEPLPSAALATDSAAASSVAREEANLGPESGTFSGGGVDASELEALVVLSAVNVLTNQMFQLLRGATPSAALALFSPDHLSSILALLVAVIDQDQPAPDTPQHQQQPAVDQLLPSVSLENTPPQPPPLPPQCRRTNQSAENRDVDDSAVPAPALPPSQLPGTTAGVQTRTSSGLKDGDPDAANAVIHVSCTSVAAPSRWLGGANGRGQRARGALLQKACLRLFVTGMDLFFPSCSERYTILARYLSKYISDGLSPARETVLTLLLRRLSDSGQLLELVANLPLANANLTDEIGTDANPFVVTQPAVVTPRASSRRGENNYSEGGDFLRSVVPAPSAFELQSLLLAVATAEGISKMNALGRRGGCNGDDADSDESAVEHGVGKGEIGEAAVEMLGRLTSQLLSSAVCVIMESDIGAFDEGPEDNIDALLQAAGVPCPPFPSPDAYDVTANTSSNDAAMAGTIHSYIKFGRPAVAGGVEKRWLEVDLTAVGAVEVLVTAMCRSCSVLAAQAVATVDGLTGDLDGGGKGVLCTEGDLLLQDSPLGAILPMLASTLTLLIDKHGSKLQGRLSGLAREVVGVMTWVSKVLERVPEKRLSVVGGGKGVGMVQKSVVMESKHNYDPLTKETLELHIDGAKRMVVTFDERSRTEEGYDYLIFWKDEAKRETWHPQTPKLTGTGPSCNFPGFGGRPPLVIEADRTWIDWKTDGSNEDWGWKFTATAEVKKSASGGDGSGYWLLGLDRQLAGAGAALAGCLVISKPWSGKAEDDNAPWMEDDLLAGARDVSDEAAADVAAPSPTATAAPLGASTSVASTTRGAATSAPRAVGVEHSPPGPPAGLEDPPREQEGGSAKAAAARKKEPSQELAMLLEVVDRLQGTGGTALCKAMRARVAEDQGSVEAVNRAVYATCAALIWHQGLGVQALALAEGTVTTPSKALAKAWRFGQQMRQYFDYGDVRDAVNSQMELQRQQVVALDASRRASSALSLEDAGPSKRPILSRGPSVYHGAEEKVIAEVSERIVSRALFLLNLPSQAGRVSRQEQSKRRWSLLARLSSLGGMSTMTRTPSQSQTYLADGAELLEKWKEVVDEATAMRKLKSVLNYRRKAAEMRERAKENSVSERIMNFVQCPADVEELELVRQCRDQRASLRAEGLRLTRALVAAAGSPPAKAWLLSSHSHSIRLTKREDRPGAHVHYLNSVEGCAPSAHLALARQFALLVNSSLEILKGCSRPQEGETPSQAAERRVLAVSSLQALAIDFDLGDHDILKESILLQVLEPLLQGFNEPAGKSPSSPVKCGGDDASDDSSFGDACEEPSPEKPTDSRVADGAVERNEASPDSGAIEDDIAALEAELEEDGGLRGDDDDDEGGTRLMHQLRGEEAVRRAAWSLFEVLLPRCVGLEGQGSETRLEEPTSFSNRLLDVLVRQVGRASANVQRSNASLGIASFPSDDSATSCLPGSSETTGGYERPQEQTNDVPSATVAPLPAETPLLHRGMRLRRDEPGRVAAHRDMTVRHSLSLWLRRDPCPLDAKPESWYTPAKIGDTVARGPRWPLGDMIDGGPGALGTVTQLQQSEMTVTVTWEITGFKGTYKMGAVVEFPQHADESSPASVEDLLVWEVVKVDPSLGGSVIMKGGANNLTEDALSEPWGHFGLSLLGNSVLRYYAVAGDDQLFTLHSRTALEPDVWTHVAVVQAKNRCRIYIDGEEDGEALLPKHMLTPGGMVKNVLDSQHPYANNVDRLWPVHVEGAVSYSITFDPMTKTEPVHDFVRFLKDANDVDGPHYGEERYSGGRSGSPSNWPGIAGRPPLIIHAPSFGVYFHTDQSNNDWGFRMTSAACVASPEEIDEDTNEASTANLNALPVYLGQPPGYASSQKSASGYLWGASTYADVLTADQVRSLARAAPPPEPSFMEEGACVDVLSLVQRCASSTDGGVSQGGGLSLEAGASPLVSPQVLGPLLVLLLQGSLKLKLAAARLCERLLPQAPLEMVQVQLSRAGLASPLPPPPSFPGDGIRAAPLMRALLLQIGETLSVWSRPAAAAVAAAVADPPGVSTCYPPRLMSKESLSSSEQAFALAGAHVGLLRALLAKEGWSAPLATCLREACLSLPDVTKSLEEAGMLEAKGGSAQEVAKAVCDPKLWMVHACLALLGGSFQGLHVGGRAVALLGKGDDATLERCTVLAMDWPRPHLLEALEREKNPTSAKPVGSGADFVCPAKDWDNLEALGDAVVVCLHSEPDSPFVLPRTRVSPDTAPLPPAFLSALKTPPFNAPSPMRSGREFSPVAEAAIAAAQEEGKPGLIKYVPDGLVGPIVDAFGVLSAADATDKRERYKPSVVRTVQDHILESSHPHGRGVDEVYPLEFPGADSIELFFDEDCRTEKGVAYIRIYKDESKTVIWGESMYQGRDKDANWPGLYGRPIVCVPASSCVIKFHSEDANPDWGYRITAKATCKTFTHPPERPPLLGTSALSTLQACGAKALVTLVTSWPQFVPHAVPLVKPLATRALGDSDQEEERNKVVGLKAKKLVFESEHPYAHNADRKQAVRVEGATKLIITFDDRSRTENGCDYMVFYADETMSKLYGDRKYTGGKDGHTANWPGTGGRPPLEIDANHFFFQWQTDGSVNDWGWKMTVTPVMGQMDLAALPVPVLDSKLASLLWMCRDGPKEQSPATGLDKFEKEPIVAPKVPPLYKKFSVLPTEPYSFGAVTQDKKIRARALEAASGSLGDGRNSSRGPSLGVYRSGHMPKVFVVNTRDAEQVSLRAEPRRDSAEVGKVSVNTALVAMQERGDWLRVMPIPSNLPIETLFAHVEGVAFDVSGEDRATSGKGSSSGAPATQHAASPSVGDHLESVRQWTLEAVAEFANCPVALPGKGASAGDSQGGNKNPGEERAGVATVMWALRRTGDMLYLVPEEEALSHLVTLPDVGDPIDPLEASGRGGTSNVSTGSSRSGTTDFQVVDPPQGDEGPASQGAFDVGPASQLANDSSRLWSALAETSGAAVSRFSRLALTKILAGSAEDSTDSATASPLVLDDFGGQDIFLKLLRTTFTEARETGSETGTSALEVLQKKIINAAEGNTQEGRRVVNLLMSFALHQLGVAVSLGEFLCPTKAAVRMWETSHNYADNTNTYTKISFPGAKHIRVIFDEECSTEMECDFVRIYKDAEHSTFWGEHKYHGPSSNGGKIWAGVAGRPPLLVDADSMEVHFHSDSSNNDWGVRLYAYGVMQEPSGEQRAALRAKRQELGRAETEIACWLLEALAKDARGDYVKRIMYHPSNLSTLTRFLKIADENGKNWAVRLLTALLQKSCPPEAPMPRPMTPSASPYLAAENLEVMLESGGPASVLREMATNLAKAEDHKGDAPRSSLLKALVQACIVAEECQKKRDENGAQRNEAYCGEGAQLFPAAEGAGVDPSEEGANPSLPRWPERAFLKRYNSNRAIRAIKHTHYDILLAQPGYVASAGVGGRGIIRWHVKFLGLSGSPLWIGVGTGDSAARGTGVGGGSLVQQPSWLVTWSSDQVLTMRRAGIVMASTTFGPKLRAGDTVAVEVDTLKETVTFYRNQALVGLAVGPEHSSALILNCDVPPLSPWRDGDALHLAMTLARHEDEVEIVSPPLPLCPTLASLSPSGDRSWWESGRDVGGMTGRFGADSGWLADVQESLRLMSAVVNRELPTTIAAKQLLPKCQQRASVTRESPHPLPAKPSEEAVYMPGASSLEVTFDARTSMGPQDKISIFGKSDRDPERVLVGLEGGTEYISSSSRFSGGTAAGNTAAAGISVGDRVVRGPSWNWGQVQDGGPGGYGSVIDVKSWKGKPGSGIKVRWDDTDFEGLYRWDHDGSFDVLVVGHGEKSAKPVVIAGDTLSIRVEPDARSPSKKTSENAWTRGLLLQDGASVAVHVNSFEATGVSDVFMGSEYTVEAWIRLMPSNAGRLEYSNYPLLSRGIMEGISQLDIKAVASEDRSMAMLHVDMRSGDQRIGISLTGGILMPGRWGHVAFAIDAAGSAKLIVDGAEVSAGIFQGPRMVVGDCDLVLGESMESEGTLHGHVYDLRIWSRVVASVDVAAGRKLLPARDSPGLIANFTFTDDQGVTPVNRGTCADIVAMPNLACTWDNRVEPPLPPSLSHWGWRCTVTPIYPIKALAGLPELREEMEEFRRLYGGGDLRHDLALVRYVNAFAARKGFDAQRLLNCSWGDMNPTEEDLVREPLLRELSLWPPPTGAVAVGNDNSTTKSAEGGRQGAPRSSDGGVEETKGEGGALVESKEDGGGGGGAQGHGSGSTRNMGSSLRTGGAKGLDKKGGCIAARFELLQLLNRQLRQALPFFDLAQVDFKWSAAALLSTCRGLIFRVIKEPVLTSALRDTAYTGGGEFDLSLSRAKAAKHIHLGHTDTEGRWTVFGQAFRQMNTMHPKALRTHNKLYNCLFMGERAQDAGGPYRESWTMYAQELQSTALPLLIRTPNGVHAAGMGRDRYVLNPGATSPAQLEMYVFLGKLMGHAIRSKEYIGLNLSGVVWKALVGQEVSHEDLESVDVLLTRSMQNIRTIHQNKGVTRAIFSDIVMEAFTALSLDDMEVELKPGGKGMPVTWDNRLEYADLVESQRLSECCSMVKYVRKGLSMVVPVAVLGMFTWEEVETMVCGRPEVDIDLLEAVTEYSGCRREQPHIKLFWEALRDFTPEERSMLVKFTWGRTRLPLTAEGFSQRFKLQNFARTPADDYLPVAHTCFFSLELPAYSSLEVMKERLRNAIYNCQAIDGDDTFAGMQAAAMGWDWQEEEEEEG